MSKILYMTDNFLSDIQTYPIIYGFKAYIIWSNESDIKNVPTTTNYSLDKIYPVEFINIDNKNETLLLNFSVGNIGSTNDNYIVFTYYPVTTIKYDNSSVISLINSYANTFTAASFLTEKRAFVYKWVDSQNVNILKMISNSTMKLLIDLKKYRVFSNFMSISNDNIIHSHELDYTELTTNDLSFSKLQGLADISENNLSGLSGYTYIDSTDFTSNDFDFPYESFVNDICEEI